jgi:hypothetical protein
VAKSKFSRSLWSWFFPALIVAATSYIGGIVPRAVAQGTAPASAPSAPQLEPKAIEILKTACDKLASAHAMSFTGPCHL